MVDVGERLAAVQKLIESMANESGYGHFITEGTRQQWAARIVDCIDQVTEPITDETVGTSSEVGTQE